MNLQQDKKWASVQLMDRYNNDLVDCPIRRTTLFDLVSKKLDNLVVFPAPGYRSIALFASNSSATLKLLKDEEEEDSLDS
jgi:hypothetical protein